MGRNGAGLTFLRPFLTFRDDDSFLFAENLQRFVRLKGWNPDKIHYFGNKCSHRHLPIVLGAVGQCGLGGRAAEAGWAWYPK